VTKTFIPYSRWPPCNDSLLEDFAFGGAAASDNSPGLPANLVTGEPLPINLPYRRVSFATPWQKAAKDTAAVIKIGNNYQLSS
jgi:hypothetical protein